MKSSIAVVRPTAPRADERPATPPLALSVAVIALLVGLGTTGCSDDNPPAANDSGGRGSEQPDTDPSSDERDDDMPDAAAEDPDAATEDPDEDGACEADRDCDDGVACTLDSCTDGECERRAEDSLCDDSNPCTVGSCDADDGCSFEGLADGSDCRNSANTPGTCQDGDCQVECEEDADCDDGVECTVDSCDPATATCRNPMPDDGACDDSNDCTVDSCDATDGCGNAMVDNGTACVDEMDVEGQCLDSACVTDCQTQEDCDDGVDCTTDACNSTTGECVNTPNNGACLDAFACTNNVCDPTIGCQALPDDTACNDGLPCTTDTCDASSGCVSTPDDTVCDDAVACTGDVCDRVNGCVNAPNEALCDDNNDCTAESCDANLGCRSTDVTDGATCRNGAGAQGACQTGTCVVACTNNADCDDSNACNGVETCDTTGNGTCQMGSAPNCDDGLDCTTDSCDPFSGCQSVGDDSACDDSIGCTTDACSTTSGCSNAPDAASCDDSNPCTANACDVSSDCLTTDLPDGTACQNGSGDNGLCSAGTCNVACTMDSDCDDGNPCNGDETCDTANGSCQLGTPITCDDSVACTDDSCSTVTGCVFSPTDTNCDDGNDCTADTCNATTGCGQSNVVDGTLCSGGSGQCNAGTCVIGCVNDGDCDDGASCTTDSCNLTSGQCENTPSDAACDDGVGCTTDSCVPGSAGADANSGCRQTEDNASCDDSNPCTADLCDLTGDCQATPITDGTPCNNAGGTAGTCQTGTCAVQCTVDSDCNDSNVCNGDETCASNGQCQAGVALNCDDAIDCTVDSCDATNGCMNAENAAACDDGVSCTTDTCEDSSGCANAPDASACDDSNPCTSHVCDATSDCQTTNVADGTLCQNGSGDNGLCDSGACDVQCTTDSDCTDGDACNGDETCNTGTGRCLTGTALVCDDGIDCTVDGCDATTGCTNSLDNASCDDTVACTTDICDASSGCLNTPSAASCDDGNDCTAELCDATAGCQSSNVADGTACGAEGTCDSGQCISPRLLRFDSMRLEDPHLIADYQDTLQDICGDMTNDAVPAPTLGQDLVAFNPVLDAAFAGDPNNDGLIDQGKVLDFDDLDQSDGATGIVNVVQSNCFTATDACSAVASGDNATFDYTVSRTTDCALTAVANLDGRTWPGPSAQTSILNQPVAGTDGCFQTTNSEASGTGQTFVVRLSYLRTAFVLPLQDASFAGTFAGTPATGITNGLVAGFLTMQDADVDIVLLAPLVSVVNVKDDLMPDGSSGPACTAAGLMVPNGIDTHPQLGSGWWVYLDATATAVGAGIGY